MVIDRFSGEDRPCKQSRSRIASVDFQLHVWKTRFRDYPCRHCFLTL
jgi:hypothetical protein